MVGAIALTAVGVYGFTQLDSRFALTDFVPQETPSWRRSGRGGTVRRRVRRHDGRAARRRGGVYELLREQVPDAEEVLSTDDGAWTGRVELRTSALVVHLHAAASLTITNRRARGAGYAGPRDWVAADFAGRTMRWTGIIVLLYVFSHLADLTWGIEPAATGEHVHGDVVASFSRPVVAGAYVLANLAFGVHLYHGVWSLFQSLGLSHHRLNRIKRPLAVGFTLVVVGANVSFPIAVFTGIVS